MGQAATTISPRDLIAECQHLFAMNLSELGKTSLVQHDIKLDDMTPFMELHWKDTSTSV